MHLPDFVFIMGDVPNTEFAEALLGAADDFRIAIDCNVNLEEFRDTFFKGTSIDDLYKMLSRLSRSATGDAALKDYEQLGSGSSAIVYNVRTVFDIEPWRRKWPRKSILVINLGAMTRPNYVSPLLPILVIPVIETDKRIAYLEQELVSAWRPVSSAQSSEPPSAPSSDSSSTDPDIAPSDDAEFGMKP